MEVLARPKRKIRGNVWLFLSLKEQKVLKTSRIEKTAGSEHKDEG